MTIERSELLIHAAREGQQKFDYFVLGIIGALCAFIGQSFQPDIVGINPSTLELAALLVLVGSAVAGFRRIESTHTIIQLNADMLRQQHPQALDLAKRALDLAINRGAKIYRLRNRLLLLGFLALLGSRVWSAYV